MIEQQRNKGPRKPKRDTTRGSRKYIVKELYRTIGYRAFVLFF